MQWKKKSDQQAREIRSKQRFEKVAHKRHSQFSLCEDKSLVLMIFFMIERETNEGETIDQETFERFLHLVDEEIRTPAISDRKINEQVTSQLLQKYSERLMAFEEVVLKGQPTERLRIIEQSETAKMLDLIRFLFRIQIIKESLLEILDAFLEVVQLKMTLLCESDSLELNFNNFVQQLTQLTQLKCILFKQIFYLHYMMKQIQTDSQDNGQGISQQFTHESKIIGKLLDKWINHQVLFQFTFNPRITNKLNNQTSPQILKLNKLVQGFFIAYFEYVDREEEKIIDRILENQFVQNNPEKVIELVFGILFILDASFSEKQIEISDTKTEEKQYELFLFIDLMAQILRKIQDNKVKNHNGFLREILTMTVNCFGELPKIAIKDFCNKKQMDKVKDIHKIRASSQYFVSEKLCDKLPLVVRLIHRIEEMEHEILVNFVQLLSIFASLSEAMIETMLRMEAFKSSYVQTMYNFKNLLETYLIEHFSLEVKRRAVWLLSNITASEQYYRHGFYLIEKLFVDNALKQDHALENLTKDQQIFNDYIIHTIINYLSNLRHYGEVTEMMELKRPAVLRGKVSENQQPSEQHLLGWVMGLLSQGLINISQSRMSALNEKSLEVLIWSLFNLLTLESNRTQFSHQTQNVVFILMERLEIPKNLEFLYNQRETSSTKSRYFGMLEDLLDLIQKAKQQE